MENFDGSFSMLKHFLIDPISFLSQINPSVNLSHLQFQPPPVFFPPPPKPKSFYRVPKNYPTPKKQKFVRPYLQFEVEMTQK